MLWMAFRGHMGNNSSLCTSLEECLVCYYFISRIICLIFKSSIQRKGAHRMWFNWVMWGIVIFILVITIILLIGKGSMIVSGFNTKSPEERAEYDKRKVSRQAGVYMVFVDFGLIALATYVQCRIIPAIQHQTIATFGTEITIVALAISAYVIMIGVIAAIRGFKHSLK